MRFVLAMTFTVSTIASAFSASQIAEKCEEKITNSSQKLMTASDEITDLQPMGENNFVVTYYMYGTCYGSVFVEIAPTKGNELVATDCDIVSVEEDYYPRCH